nr:hypothetical protein [Tanacetum cinerariifolium]
AAGRGGGGGQQRQPGGGSGPAYVTAAHVSGADASRSAAGTLPACGPRARLHHSAGLHLDVRHRPRSLCTAQSGLHHRPRCGARRFL